MATELLEDSMAHLYQAFMSQNVCHARSDDSGSFSDDENDNDDDDEDGDVYTSDGSEEGWIGDFGDLMGHILHSFATEPDLDHGFRFSHKFPSHRELVEVCENLRRQLATTLVSIKDPRHGSTRGMLDHQPVAISVAQKIDELGNDTDKLSAACKTAKRGDAGLAEQTELMQHRVSQLGRWIEMLRKPGLPALPMEGRSGCGHPSCPCARSNPVSTRGISADIPNPYGSQSQSSHVQTLADPVEAADEAMQKLLQEEEAEKQRQSKKTKGKQKAANVAKPKKQRHKNRGEKHSQGQSGCAGASTSVASAASAADDSHALSEPETTDMVTASGQPVTVSRVNDNLLNIVHSSFQARMEAKRMTTSTFRALEMLGDDEAPEEWHVAQHKKKPNKRKPSSFHSDPASSEAKSAAGPSRLQSQLDARNAHRDAANLPQGAVPDRFEVKNTAHTFMLLVEREGRWEHHWLVNALNPVTQQHNVKVRAAYKSLDKAVQQYIWKLLPSATPIKHPQPSFSTAQVAQGLGSATPRHPSQSGSSPSPLRSSLSPDAMSVSGAKFMRLLEQYGVKSQVSLTNALNPSSATHVPAVRAANKTLSKMDSKHVWHMLPKHSVAKKFAPSAVPAGTGFPPQPAAWKSSAPRAMSRIAARPTPGSRPSFRSRPVPGSRPIAPNAASFHQTGVALEDPIPEELNSTLQTTTCNVPTWVSSAFNDGGDDESKLCCVCLDQVRDALLVPCNHAVTCTSCAITIKDKTAECPYCRVKIENVLCVR